jgi:ribulose-5-phosphate 4-epimerase/fuculose-1-phosphate aldolase
MTRLASDLAQANRILSNENIMDAFGHVSCRHPDDPELFLLSTALPPVLVQEADIVEYTMAGAPVRPTDRRLYSEAVIHSEIYKARPDVNAVCHHHSLAVLPFCVSGTPLVPIFQTAASMGTDVPFWDSQDDFGDTDLLLTIPEHGASLARALGQNWMVLMRRHGATVVGRTLKETVFRAMHSAANAAAQLQAALLGHVDHLTPGEVTMAGGIGQGAVDRNWAYAAARLGRAER